MSERVVPIFEDLVRSPARLLRVAVGPDLLVLTFDVAILIFEPSVDRADLRAARIPDADALPDGVRSADEDEPWWPLLGNELTGASAHLSAEGRRTACELQFRRPEEGPRLVSVALHDGGLKVSARRG